MNVKNGNFLIIVRKFDFLNPTFHFASIKTFRNPPGQPQYPAENKQKRIHTYPIKFHIMSVFVFICLRTKSGGYKRGDRAVAKTL